MSVAEPSIASVGLAPTSGFDVTRYLANTRGGSLGSFGSAEAITDYYLVCLSRAMDDRNIALQKQGKAWFQISGAGHEVLGVALARYLRPSYDWFFPYYRDMGLMLALGISPYELLLHSVGSSDDPASGARQMPSHWGHKATNVVSQSSPTGSQCLPAVGCAEAARYIVNHSVTQSGGRHVVARPDEVTYVSVGDGTTSEGEFWEALNSACVQNLSVFFLVEDNGFAISVPQAVQASAGISQLVSGFTNLEVLHCDGTDYRAVREVAGPAIIGMRARPHPVLLHADVTRPYSHSAADTQSKYRTAQELSVEAEHDPLNVFRRLLHTSGVLDQQQTQEIWDIAVADVAAAAKQALRAPRPDPKSVLEHRWDLDRVPRSKYVANSDSLAASLGASTSDDPSRVVMYGEAITYALGEAMQGDIGIRVFGEDVADARPELLDQLEGKGGVFGTTHGLQKQFGSDRCFNTPLAEANIVGRAVGMATRGLHPAPEIQFFDYVWPAMTQIRSEAATMRWRSNGAFTCPMVIRLPIGGYLVGGSIWHSQSGESIFAHIPGLLIAYPSRARDVIGLMRAAFRYEDPVLFLEHKHLLRQGYTADELPSADFVIPFGIGDVRRPGSDLTIVTWGATVQKSLEAAAQLEAQHDYSVEVFDLRTIQPWDRDGIATSVAKTSRLLVVHEDTLSGGWGAEIAAWAGEALYTSLDAPVSRHGALDTHVGYEPTLEAAVLPTVETISTADLKTLRF